ncbi:hypothetical protein [Micromonospora auratinigra]|uniref:Secreted protein n=1 Tax=Micromonospora auratinigra TaxID=261654 RepID=A0A1A8ZEZ2_9ACTN|nr:hypothetical protein [Micromonospora auratinigra]SBT42573.1 hypothetical protein GA0070611_2026 [Micromonospora auratinigra]
MSAVFADLVRGDVPAVRSFLSGLDEPARRALGDELVDHVRRRRDNWWWGAEATALAVAAVGTLSTPAKAAALLGRRSVFLRDAAPDPVVETARERGVTWLAELAYRLADRLPRTEPLDGWRFVAGLLTAEKAAPPTGDTFVAGWAADLWWPPVDRCRLPVLDRLRADPFLAALLPRLFEVDGVGLALDRGGVGDDRDALPRALVALATEGRLDRVVLLDGVLGRLLRGDRPAALRPFLALHDLLAPTSAEVAPRSAAYLRLLADAPGRVAATAQRTLREHPGAVELPALLDRAGTVLGRPEKALVKAQLSWLDRLARQRPEQAAEIGAVLALGAAHPAAELRDRATDLARRHGHRPAAPVTVTVARDDLPPPVPAAAALPPVTDTDELVEEVAALLGDHRRPAPLVERVLDGLVRVATTDRARLADALLPVLRRHHLGEFDHMWSVFNLHVQLDRVLLAAAGAEVGVRRDEWAGVLAESVRRVPLPFRRRSTVETPRRPAVTQLYCARLAEIGQRLDGRDDPGLLAAPTSSTGAVDPTVLYERLAALGDRPVWRWDLTQALLRLPAGPDEVLAARAAALGTTAGDELAGWLRGDALPAPVQRVVTVGRRDRHGDYDWYHDRLPEQRTVVTATPPEGVVDPLGLLTVRAYPVGRGSHGGDDGLWPALLPGYRGLVAAHLLPEIAGAAQEDAREGATVLPLLAECTGAGGPALDLALAYGLCARHEVDRVAALDALLMLAAAGDLDAPAVGARLGELAATGQVILTRAATPLRDAVAAGAPLSTWRLLAAALPPLLAVPAPPRGTPDLLTLAAETATTTGVRLDVPGLADVVARGGGTRLVTEARRLTAALTP